METQEIIGAITEVGTPTVRGFDGKGFENLAGVKGTTLPSAPSPVAQALIRAAHRKQGCCGCGCGC